LSSEKGLQQRMSRRYARLSLGNVHCMTSEKIMKAVERLKEALKGLEEPI